MGSPRVRVRVEVVGIRQNVRRPGGARRRAHEIGGFDVGCRVVRRVVRSEALPAGEGPLLAKGVLGVV